MQRFSYTILEIDLTAGKNNAEYLFAGTQIYYDTGETEVTIRLESTDADPIPLSKTQRITVGKGLFSKFYLSAPATAETIKLFISNPDEIKKETGQVRIDHPVLEFAQTPYIYNKTCAIAGQEYNQALPGGTKRFHISARGGDLKVCLVSGQSGVTYIFILDGETWAEEDLKLTGKTLYFQSPTAGAIAEIAAWV